jgi:EAL domain-containing protein (putative c-di-GMP-specific phosphodiesterase class I)
MTLPSGMIQSASSCRLPAYVVDELRHWPVRPGRLIVEITETAAGAGLQDAQRFIATAREAGCGRQPWPSAWRMPPR